MSTAAGHRELLDKLMQKVLEDAADRRVGAGQSGSFGDGGATTLEEQVKFFRYGLSASVPQEWEPYKKQLDPEYIEYLRLKRKFG